MAIKHWTTVDGFAVTIQGRIDGVYEPASGQPWVVEEIKSVVLAPLAFAALRADAHPQHAEQLRLYCYFVEQTANREHQSAHGGPRFRVADAAPNGRAGARPSDEPVSERAVSGVNA